MSKVLFTKKEVEELMFKALLAEDYEVDRYRYPDGTIYDLNEEEAEEFIKNSMEYFLNKKM